MALGWRARTALMSFTRVAGYGAAGSDDRCVSHQTRSCGARPNSSCRFAPGGDGEGPLKAGRSPGAASMMVGLVSFLNLRRGRQGNQAVYSAANHNANANGGGIIESAGS
jgi:hypothetical protein